MSNVENINSESPSITIDTVQNPNTVKSTLNSKNVHEPQLHFLGRVPIDNLSPVTPINPEILKQKKEMEGRWEGSEEWDLGNVHKNVTEQEIPKFSVSQNYIVCALKHKFIVLEQKLPKNEPSFSTASTPEGTPTSTINNDNIDLNYYESVVTGGESEKNDYITSVLCLPVLKSVQMNRNKNQSNRSNMFILVGYHSGYFKIYSITGKLILSYWLHSSPLLKIKTRSIGSQLYGPPDNDELILLFEDKKIVIIDGLNLWYTLRSRTSIDGEKIDNMEGALPTLSYRKWEFNHQDSITDIVSLGNELLIKN